MFSIRSSLDFVSVSVVASCSRGRQFKSRRRQKWINWDCDCYYLEICTKTGVQKNNSLATYILGPMKFSMVLFLKFYYSSVLKNYRKNTENFPASLDMMLNIGLVSRKMEGFLLLCKWSIWFTEQHIFKLIIHFLIHQNVPQIKYVISFEVYDGFIGQKILKLCRQESWPFSPGWAANIMRIHSWTFRLPCI